ncbi:hypothetical protein GF374_00890 [Candidatus Woesearchaeota archaeon]|nr:hypothetical protein [Candidatus Woesearchaeota archaeon]
MKQKLKEDFLRISHITKVTTDKIIKLYNSIPKFYFSYARNGYITRAKEQRYIAENENYLFFFICGWNSATNKPEAKATS